MKIRILLLAVVAGILMVPIQSRAVTRAGLFKISLDSKLFGFCVGERDFDDGGDPDFESPTVGIGLSSAGIGFGYTVINGLVIGARVTTGLEGLDVYHIDDEVFIWSVLPYAEYIFLSGLVRPFVMGTLGFEGMRTDDFGNDTWWWGFTFGGGGGVHFFVVENVSIDATLLATFTVGTGEQDNNRGPDEDFSHWHFKFSTLAGMSAWF
ncbi:MAG: hypothetical protein GY847_39890 [Proteobacteria bacterium]|nr:hypothetical protein [Pseudomonadota bacterium]